MQKQLTVEEIKRSHKVIAYLTKSTEYLGRLGFTEHGLRHAGLVSKLAIKY